MTVSRAELQRLTPEDVARYLSSTGWQPAGDLNGRATVWELARRDIEVIVPVSTRFRDYPQRVYEVVRTLAEVESRPEPAVLRSLADTHTDRQYFRLFPDAPSGLISAADAAEAFLGVRELFIASAYTEHYGGDRLVLPGPKAKPVREFPEKALVATEPGSFVISAQVAVPPDDGTLFGGRSFERRVLLRLRQALISARTAADEAADLAELSPFVNRAHAGVSKTLCQGLARFGGVDNDRPFEVGFSWASAVPADLPDAPGVTVRFEKEHAAMLAHAAEDLGQKPRFEEHAEIRGNVRAMERDRPDAQGWVVVRGALSVKGAVSKNRQVWVPLTPDDYDRALRAHGQGLQVRVAGRLTRTGLRTELAPSDHFRVL